MDSEKEGKRNGISKRQAQMTSAIPPRRVRMVSATKIEWFCQAIVAGKSQSDAYRVAFKPNRMKANTVHSRACEMAARSEVRVRLAELMAPIKAVTEWTLAERMAELACAGRLDPIDLYDEHGQPKRIVDMPEHARRAIAGFEVDAEKFTTKIKLIDKRAAIMDYTKLAGDMPVEKTKLDVTVTTEYLVGLLKRKEPKLING
jgi:hypothetical protein